MVYNPYISHNHHICPYNFWALAGSMVKTIFDYIDSYYNSCYIAEELVWELLEKYNFSYSLFVWGSRSAEFSQLHNWDKRSQLTQGNFDRH